MVELAVSGPLVFEREGGAHLQIGADPLAVFMQYVQDSPEKLEGGGVLLGRHLRDSRDIIVDFLTQPMADDHRSRFSFFRSQQAHQAEIDRMWQESGGTCTYLGEWHTHAEEDPTPSGIDRFDWHRRLSVDRFTEPLFFVIVGTKHVRGWEGWRTGSLIPLQNK